MEKGRMKDGIALSRDFSAQEETARAGYRDGSLSAGVIAAFRRLLLESYRLHGRDLPWRRTTDPYRILVSEFMLQQTQVERVLAKYPEFLGRFPDIGSLARARLREVLLAWQGLGYNRRALALHRTARNIREEFGGRVPLDRDTLDSFPGIGSATAGAIFVFSTNRPEIFIETNIRRVYIHLFFPDAEKVHDREIIPILEKTLDRKNPRRFYYSLMDYGALLGRSAGNPTGSFFGGRAKNQNIRSTSYTRQAPFPGSDRQARGAILRHLLADGETGETGLADLVPGGPARLERVLGSLEKDGFIGRAGGRIRFMEGSG